MTNSLQAIMPIGPTLARVTWSYDMKKVKMVHMSSMIFMGVFSCARITIVLISAFFRSRESSSQ